MARCISVNPPADNTQAQQEQIRDSHLTRGMGNMASSDADEPETAVASTAAAPVNRTPGSTTNEEMCTKARANLQTLNSAPQVRRVDPDTGQISMMTPKQKQEEVARTQALVDQYCG